MTPALPSDDLAPGTLREVVVDRRRVLLARLRSGEVCAMAPSCPHEAARLTTSYPPAAAYRYPRALRLVHTQALTSTEC